MTLPAPTYDLVLLLDAQAEDSARAKILADARAAIQARGEIVTDDDWGERPLAYPIERRKSAEYHLFQFHVSDKDLLSGLDRTLRITDGVVRFRLIKLRPGVPAPPDMRTTSAPARRPEGEPAAAAPEGAGAPAPGDSEPVPAASVAEPIPAASAPPPAAETAPPAEQAPAAAEVTPDEPAAAEPAAPEPAAAEGAESGVPQADA